MRHWTLFSREIPPPGREKVYLIKAKDAQKNTIEIHTVWYPMLGAPMIDMEASGSTNRAGVFKPLAEGLTPIEWISLGDYMSEAIVKRWMDYSSDHPVAACYRLEFAVFTSHLAEPVMLTAFEPVDEAEAPEPLYKWGNRRSMTDDEIRQKIFRHAHGKQDGGDDYEGADSD